MQKPDRIDFAKLLGFELVPRARFGKIGLARAVLGRRMQGNSTKLVD